MAANNYPNDGEPNHIARIAIEQLLNRQEDDHSPEAADRRAARRLCGRWIAHRRMLRGLSRADVARRIKLDETALSLLELGLIDAPLTAGEVWHRLALVLEGDIHDYEQVEMAIGVALGRTVVPDGDWLAVLDAELTLAEVPPVSVETGELKAEDLPPETLVAADELLHKRLGDIPQHSLPTLRALRRAPGQTLSTAALKLSVEAHESIELGFAELRKLLTWLEERRFVQQTSDPTPRHKLTSRGAKALLVALQNTHIERMRQEADQAFDQVFSYPQNTEGSA